MPRIYYRNGYWRVTPWDHRTKSLPLYNKAHEFVSRLNTRKE